MNKGKIVIVAGGTCDLSLYRDILKDAYLIGADRGALYLADNGYKADLAAGDFDSVTKTGLDRIYENSFKVETLPREKDETDLEYAVKHALGIPGGTIHILGATGTRLDQTFSALHLLKLIHDKGRTAFLYDSHNRIRLIEGKVSIKRDRYKYVSLIPYGDRPVKVSLKGFKYSGENIILKKISSMGVSNEILEDEAEIESGECVFLFESED
ncbi:MAG: thiamine diphosphokinase [Lachnospiraceae bacterium]|nr:thiamine diphosphokinase [Lachnospiraceae bacterium]